MKKPETFNQTTMMCNVSPVTTAAQFFAQDQYKIKADTMLGSVKLGDEFDEDNEEFDFLEKSPNRLVIDDSIETQARQEKIERLNKIDESIEAVIGRLKDDSQRKRDKKIDEKVASPDSSSRVKNLFRKDVYDFSDDSSENSSSDNHFTQQNKKKKTRKRTLTTPRHCKNNKSSKKKKHNSKSVNLSHKLQDSKFMLRVEDRTPSPILQNDVLSTESSSSSSSPSSSPYFDRSPPLSHSSPGFSGTGFSSNLFAPIKQIPGHIQPPHFPTPPLFRNDARSNLSFQQLSNSKQAEIQNIKEDNSHFIKRPAMILKKNKDDRKPKIPEKLNRATALARIAELNNRAHAREKAALGKSSKSSTATMKTAPSSSQRSKASVSTAVPASTKSRGRKRKAESQPKVPPARTVITETVGTIVDESGNKIWICPACSGPDDGSPMIGCDDCDDWYHWECVNIVVPPKEEEDWFCSRCTSKAQDYDVKQQAKKKKKFVK